MGRPLTQVPRRFVANPARYPTEADARHALESELAVGHTLGEYRGLWRMPTGPVVHLFTDADPEWLTQNGWFRSSGTFGSVPVTGGGPR
jgi:hypothetical protein